MYKTGLAFAVGCSLAIGACAPQKYTYSGNKVQRIELALMRHGPLAIVTPKKANLDNILVEYAKNRTDVVLSTQFGPTTKYYFDTDFDGTLDSMRVVTNTNPQNVSQSQIVDYSKKQLTAENKQRYSHLLSIVSRSHTVQHYVEQKEKRVNKKRQKKHSDDMWTLTIVSSSGGCG